jgi:hypothetical protein
MEMEMETETEMEMEMEMIIIIIWARPGGYVFEFIIYPSPQNFKQPIQVYKGDLVNRARQPSAST